MLAAWVLWVQYETIAVGETKYERSWQPESAYPDNGYTQCIQDAQVLAQNTVENRKNMPNVKRAERKTLVGQREAVYIELKTGGSFIHTYVCFPDTVKPT
jgi:hypothetical protein